MSVCRNFNMPGNDRAHTKYSLDRMKTGLIHLALVPKHQVFLTSALLAGIELKKNYCWRRRVFDPDADGRHDPCRHLANSMLAMISIASL